jgi:hypothetical protein
MPAIAPKPPKKIEEIETAPAPQSSGIRAPKVEPSAIEIHIIARDCMLIVYSTGYRKTPSPW